MRRVVIRTASALGLIAALTSSAEGQNCSSNGEGSPMLSGHGFAAVSTSSNFPNLSAVNNATDFWNSAQCGSSGGSGFDFPYLGFSGSVTVEINFINGHAPTRECGPDYCAAQRPINTTTINVYEYWGPTGQTATPLDTTTLGNLLAHEFGHVFGLGASTCPNGIMNSIVPSSPTLHSNECETLDFRNQTPSETPEGGGDGDTQCYEYCSPILVSLDHGGFRLTGPDNPVLFDIDSDGTADLITWTAGDSQTALLALDRNGNGSIDNGSELFGTTSLLGRRRSASHSSGYDVLAEFDLPEMGGNSDGVIDPHDIVWSRLRMWVDTNHNGVSEPSELGTLDDTQFIAFGFDNVLTRRRDEFGNLFRFKGKAWRYNQGGGPAVVPTFDVFFQRVQ